MTLEDVTNTIFLQLSKIYHVKIIDINNISIVDPNNKNYDIKIIDRNKSTKAIQKEIKFQKTNVIDPKTPVRKKGKKTKEELRYIALKAVATRRENDPNWGRKKKAKTKKTLN